MSMNRFGEKVICNPKVKLKKQEVYPLIDIDKIQPQFKTVKNVEEVEYTGQSCSKFKDHDILFARITPCLENGKVAIASTNGQDGVGSTELFVFRGIHGITNTDYVYYLLCTSYMRQLASNSMTGASGRQRADLTFIKKIKWHFPEIEKQERIAQILSQYDLLIEINNKRIKALELMAENLYKEWFVRFRFPGHESTEFENNIPKDWIIKRMNDFCYVTDGTHDTPEPTIEGIPLVTGKSIKNGFVDFDSTYNISEQDHEKIRKRSGLRTGDILFSNIGTVGLSCVVDYYREYSVKNVIIFKPNSDYDTTYLYYWLTSSSMQELFSSQTNGSSQQFVGLSFMRKFKILVPPIEILRDFHKLINPINEEKKKIYHINQNLIKQRDLLLPRLMSGKLEV